MSNIGRVIFGFCGGYFGRNSCEEKRIEAEGVDWIVARGLTPDASPQFAFFESEKEKLSLVKSWSTSEGGL
jgi:hypothetical protein